LLKVNAKTHLQVSHLLLGIWALPVGLKATLPPQQGGGEAEGRPEGWQQKGSRLGARVSLMDGEFSPEGKTSLLTELPTSGCPPVGQGQIRAEEKG